MTSSWLIPLAITIAAVWFAVQEDRRLSRCGYSRAGDAAAGVLAYLAAIVVGGGAWYAWSLFA